MNKSVKTNIIGELRSESISKLKISHQIGCDILSNEDITKTTNLIPSGSSAELARVMVKAYSEKTQEQVHNTRADLVDLSTQLERLE